MTTEVWLLIVVVVLVFFGGLFVMIEQALTRVSRSEVESLASTSEFRGRRRAAGRLLAILDHRIRYVNAVVMARLAVTTFAIVLVTVIAIRSIEQPRWAGPVVAGVSMLLVAFVVFGVGPRTIGQQKAGAVAIRTTRLVRLIGAVFWLPAAGLIHLGNALTPGKGYPQGPFANQTEFLEFVDLAEARRVIDSEEREMIRSVFDLGDTKVREVMVPRTEMVWIEQSRKLRSAMSLFLRSGYSRIPVVGEGLDDVLGILYLKDVNQRLFDSSTAAETMTVEKVMRPATYVPDSKPADDLLREMQAQRVHLALVVDEYGGTAGLVTIEDIVEEIVGEIADEYDEQEIPESEQIDGSTWRVSARMQLDDFAELLGLDINEDTEGVETVGGLFSSRLGKVPLPGTAIDVDGWHLLAEMAAGRRNRIGTVVATRLDVPANGSVGVDADNDAADSAQSRPERTA